jgi:hypothetical protein
MTYAAVAHKYSVSAEWVRTFFNYFRETGEVAARSRLDPSQLFLDATFTEDRKESIASVAPSAA